MNSFWEKNLKCCKMQKKILGCRDKFENGKKKLGGFAAVVKNSKSEIMLGKKS